MKTRLICRHVLLGGSLPGRLSLSVTTDTAKEAFSRAVEWQLTGRFNDVSIRDSTNIYSIAAFSAAMALLEIAKTVNDAKRRLANNSGTIMADES